MINSIETNDKLINLSNVGAIYWPNTEMCRGDYGFSHNWVGYWELYLSLPFLRQIPSKL